MGYTSAQAKEFIARIAPMMQEEARKRGYKICSAAIAQAIIEGAAGTSKLARDYHNHFGLKCGSKWKGASVNMKTKEEYKVGTLTTIKDNFRAYANDEEGVKGYYDFINTTRYANLKTAKTPLEYAQFLKQDGYATSSTYVNTLVSTVNKYGLDKYDLNKIVITDDITDCDRPILKRGDRGDAVRAWQMYLSEQGYDVGKAGCDGVLGEATEKAIMQYQQAHGIEAGYIGKQTWATLP